MEIINTLIEYLGAFLSDWRVALVITLIVLKIMKTLKLAIKAVIIVGVLGVIYIVGTMILGVI